MTHPELLKHLEEIGRDDPIIVLEPRADYDQFIIGIAERGPEIVVLYDKPALIDWLATVAGEGDDEQDPHEAAMDHFGFNMSQGGPGYPMFLDQLVDRPTVAP